MMMNINDNIYNVTTHSQARVQCNNECKYPCDKLAVNNNDLTICKDASVLIFQLCTLSPLVVC